MTKPGLAEAGVIEPAIRAEILRRLQAAEVEHGVKILFACESGSRAWGFASPDSDYDVRFIYAHPAEWYLTFDVEQRRDVIEYPIVDEIDCGGWDVRKAMYLFTRSNGALLEWLKSPIVYRESGPLAQGLRGLEARGANRRALCYHYSHMARGNAKEYLFKGQARLKKYFYVLRPLFAIRFIEAHDRPPPIEFRSLVDAVAPEKLIEPIERLLALKSESSEMGLGPPVPIINDFIAGELERHGEAFKGAGRPDMQESRQVRDELNGLFRTVLTD